MSDKFTRISIIKLYTKIQDQTNSFYQSRSSKSNFMLVIHIQETLLKTQTQDTIIPENHISGLYKAFILVLSNKILFICCEFQ